MQFKCFSNRLLPTPRVFFLTRSLRKSSCWFMNKNMSAAGQISKTLADAGSRSHTSTTTGASDGRSTGADGGRAFDAIVLRRTWVGAKMLRLERAKHLYPLHTQSKAGRPTDASEASIFCYQMISFEHLDRMGGQQSVDAGKPIDLRRRSGRRLGKSKQHR